MTRPLALLAATGLLLSPVGAVPTATAVDRPTCGGRPATIVGTPKNDRLVGTPGRDVIVGLGGRDRIDGRGGDDLICGNDGGDRLVGGPGDDELYGGRGTYREYPDEPGESLIRDDILAGGAGDDLLVPGVDRRARRSATLGDEIDYSAAPRPLRADLATGVVTGEGRDRIRGRGYALLGSAYDDVLTGSNRADVIFAGPGSDVVLGRGGDDWLRGSDLSRSPRADDVDELRGGGGDDSLDLENGGVVRGGAGDDDIFSTNEAVQQLYGDAGDDTLDGWLRPLPGQVFDGGEGRNRVSILVSAENADTFGAARTTIDLAAGQGSVPDLGLTFVIRGVRWFDSGIPLLTFLGTDGPDYVMSWADTRRFVGDGRGGDDVFVGTYSADVIDGGPGHDTADGSGGRDTCRSIEDATSCEAS